MEKRKRVTLKNVVVKGQKHIGLLHYQDKVLEAMVQSLEGSHWDDDLHMYTLPKSRGAVQSIFKKFRGVAWVDLKYYYPNRPLHQGSEVLNLDWYRMRKVDAGYRVCPEAFLTKLEVKRYAWNTARTYIRCFEAFINYYKDDNLMDLDDDHIRAYLQYLSHMKKSDSYVNQSINSIKFYYEVVHPVR
jgi:hypothetical protein